MIAREAAIANLETMITRIGVSVSVYGRLTYHRRLAKTRDKYGSPLAVAEDQVTQHGESKVEPEAAEDTLWLPEMTRDIDLLDQIRAGSEVCSRLEAWAQKPTTSRTIGYTQGLVRDLVASIRDFEQGIAHESLRRDPETADLEGGAAWPASVLEPLKRAPLIQDVLIGVLDCCVGVEDWHHRDEEPLNFLFCSLGGRVRNPYNVEGLQDLGRELTESLAPWFGPQAAANNYTWGLSDPSPRVRREIRFDLPLATRLPKERRVVNNINDSEALQCSIEKTARAFSPRYVRTYRTRDDIPYAIDTSSPSYAGSFGVVRKVHRKVANESFAEKTYGNLFSRKERKVVLDELGVLEILSHPNIVNLVEAYEIADEPHTINIVMSPWAPFTLDRFLYATDSERKQHFAWFEPNTPASDIGIYSIMLQLASAVGHLHSISIKHKDIKPDNILLHTAGGQVTPYITDVGVSKVYWRGVKTNYDKSTYPFLSLEQLEHQESSLKSDIWQLGCCFAMILALMRGGQQGVVKLHVSYNRTDESCSCNIAKEYEWFMGALKELCSSASARQKHMLWVITRMLDLNPSSRFDIQMVEREMDKLYDS
ncbi:serine/threonine protein kinase [Colletotrichum sojae]|uniref:Serine/threonine protein kinase n=1 Tax=Colletotrichum sojae TaxID=2175907 RepID=A0A8H6J6X1_9PEZI|nr:serine/threonine protein kinase [Colletotrichum sojae]